MAFANALHAHPALIFLNFLLSTVPSTKQRLSNINPILTAISTIPNLKRLVLGCWLPPLLETVDDQATEEVYLPLARVCGHPRLESLRLEYFRVGRSFRSAFTAIQNSTSLESLMVAIQLDDEEQCRSLAKIVQLSPTLDFLRIILTPCENDHHLSLIIESLHVNFTITKLSIVFRRTSVFSSSIQESLVTMLEKKNLTIERIELRGNVESEGRGIVLKMMHFAKLNRLGRKYLLENPNAPHGKWVETLASTRNDLNALYYFLSLNPSLCDLTSRKRDPTCNSGAHLSRPLKKIRSTH